MITIYFFTPLRRLQLSPAAIARHFSFASQLSGYF